MRSVVRFGVVFGSEGSVAPLPLALSTLSGEIRRTPTLESHQLFLQALTPRRLRLLHHTWSRRQTFLRIWI